MQSGTCGKHPAGKDLLYFALLGDFLHFDKGVCLGGFCQGACVTGPRPHAQGAELYQLVNINRKCGDAAGDFIKAGKICDGICNAFGLRACA